MRGCPYGCEFCTVTGFFGDSIRFRTNESVVEELLRGGGGNPAGEFERLAGTSKDPQVARNALWQSAELYEKGNARPLAAKSWERYVKQYPQPLEPAVAALAAAPARDWSVR